ncbi:hypothetical protein B0J11DRAFT_507791 [Dendryphion nanum]|uniref:Uncharacterized protein n=1 Tax=Dendryphion nanum TaxID=256645 RepID=A0A9P9IKM8_9PLEO|nr:hypothetical protein B0J11DRAFT_507791 [Dendryphion nanum]
MPLIYSVAAFVSSAVSNGTVETKNEEFKETEEHEIRAGDQLCLYQRAISGPGMRFNMRETASATDRKRESEHTYIYFDVVYRPVHLVENLFMVLKSSHEGGGAAPSHYIKSYPHGKGSFLDPYVDNDAVYIVPSYTLDSAKACTSIALNLEGNQALLAKVHNRKSPFVPILSSNRTNMITEVVMVEDEKFESAVTKMKNEKGVTGLAVRRTAQMRLQCHGCAGAWEASSRRHTYAVE